MTPLYSAYLQVLLSAASASLDLLYSYSTSLHFTYLVYRERDCKARIVRVELLHLPVYTYEV
jgi:hypothetical protein